MYPTLAAYNREVWMRDGRVQSPVAGRETVMTNLVRWFKNVAKGPLIADLPPELLQCEFGCRVRECSQGKWLTCENRIRCMHEEMAFSHSKPEHEAAVH